MRASSKQLARRWLSHAEGDLAAATTILQRQAGNQPFTAGFHAQQTAEKAIKAVLVARQISFSRAHDLDALHRLVPIGTHVKALSGLGALNPYAVEERYPVPGEEPHWADVSELISLARDVLAAATEDVAEKPDAQP